MKPAAGVAVTGIGVLAPGAEQPIHALAPAPVGPPPAQWSDAAVAALPGRGHRRLPAACRYLLVASHAALRDCGGYSPGSPPELRGVVVGSNNANVALLAEMDRVIMTVGAAELSPSRAPYFSLSVTPSRLSTEHDIKGFVLTTTSPRTAGLDAIQVGARALATRRATALLVGATEETLPMEEPGAEFSDVGAVVLACEPIDRRAPAAHYGTCVVSNAFLAPGALAADVLDGAWRRLGLPPGHEVPIDAFLDDSPVGAEVAKWVAGHTVFPAPAGCLAPLRRVAGLLAAGAGPRVVLTAAAQGNVAFVHITPSPPNRRP